MPQIPDDDILEILLDTAYHASFLTEEDRKCRFRLIYISFDEIDSTNSFVKKSDRELRVIPFSDRRNFSSNEINRLSPVAEYERMLICVHNFPDENQKINLMIWGILDTGENWWRFIHNESSSGRPPPNALTIESLNPGELKISTQGYLHIALRDGQISQHEQGSLWSGPLADFLNPSAKRLYQEVIEKQGTKKWDKDDDDYPNRSYIYFLERILFHIQQKKHGGCLIIVPRNLSRNDTRFTDRINLKYPCDYNFAWDNLVRHLINHKKYYDLYFKLYDGKIKLEQKAFSELFHEYSRLNSEKDEIEECLADIARSIACLSTIDGAVIMDDSFHVIGFGAEVIAHSPSLKEFFIHGAEPRQIVPIDNFGTRHRSAFRFCSSFDDSIAFIVSQDGGVKATKRVLDKLYLWPDII